MTQPISPPRLSRHLLGAVVPAALLLGMATAALAQGGAAPSAAPPAASAAGSQAPPVAAPPTGSAIAPAAVPPTTAPPTPPPTATPAPAAPPPVQQPPPQYVAPLPVAVAAPIVFSAAGGRVILSADRLFGVSSWSSASTSDQGNIHIETEASGTMVNLLWSNSAIGSGGGANIYAMPRLSVDGFVGPNFTLGGSIGYLSTGGSRTVPDPNSTINPNTGCGVRYLTRDFPDSTGFIIQPRIGVAIPVGEHAALWLRAGITYFHSTTESTETDVGGTPSNPTSSTFTSTSTTNGTALTLDPVIVFLPVAHVGLTIGPAIDVGLGGSAEGTATSSGSGVTAMTTTSTADIKMSNYGAAAGLLVFF